MTSTADAAAPIPGAKRGLALARRISPTAAFLAVLLGVTLLRVAFAATSGLGNDESYTVVTSRAVALSYFDHPPLAWWLARLSAWLFGSESPLAVRAPFLALSTFLTFLMYRLTAKLFDPWAGVLAALMMACAPVLGVTSAAWVLPDGPLIAFLLAATLALAHVLFDREAHPAGWLLAGLLGGLALLSKYHGVFFFAGTFLFLVASPRHRFWLLSPWPYAGALVGLVVFLPAVIWNVEHHFASLSFQGGRAVAAQFRPWMSLVAVGGIALFLTPWIWVGLVAAALRAARTGPRAPRALLLLCLAGGPVLFFPLVAVWSPDRPFLHWAAPGYLMLFPLLGRAMARRWTHDPQTPRWAFGSVAFTTMAMSGVMLLSLAPTLTAPGSSPPLDPLRELAEWEDLREAFRTEGFSPGRYGFVAVRSWHDGGKAGYALGPGWPVVCLGEDCRGFLFTHGEDGHEGADAVLILPGLAGEAEVARLRAHFMHVEALSHLHLRHAGAEVGMVTLLIGRGYRGGG